MDWYASEFSVGAFGEFAPGQSGTLLPEMLSPAGKGDRVHFAGDTLSIGHAWIVGGLNSGFRVVQDIVVKGLGRLDLGMKLSSEWGPLVSLYFYIISYICFVVVFHGQSSWGQRRVDDEEKSMYGSGIGNVLNSTSIPNVAVRLTDN